jgi:Tfp pilus assembly ATPase PilU
MFVGRTGINKAIGEVASTAARNPNFFSHLVTVID